MSTNKPLNPGFLRFGGIAGIITLIFIPAIIIQINTGWFPELDLQAGTMNNWLHSISEDPSKTMWGIGLFIIAILAFFPHGLTIYSILPKISWLRVAAFTCLLLGVTLALTAFLFGFGFTWAMLDLVSASSSDETDQLVPIATMGMRGFLVSDDLATCLIGVGNGFFSLAAFRSKLLPKWLCWWGIIAGILVTIVLLRYSIPIFGFTTIGYPLVVLWFSLTGIVLIRKAGNM